MAYIKTKITNCRTASIRKVPWIPAIDEEIVEELPNGASIDINPDNVTFDWKDRKFYRTKNPKGWIHEGVVEYEEG